MFSTLCSFLWQHPFSLWSLNELFAKECLTDALFTECPPYFFLHFYPLWTDSFSPAAVLLFLGDKPSQSRQTILFLWQSMFITSCLIVVKQTWILAFMLATWALVLVWVLYHNSLVAASGGRSVMTVDVFVKQITVSGGWWMGRVRLWHTHKVFINRSADKTITQTNAQYSSECRCCHSLIKSHFSVSLTASMTAPVGHIGADVISSHISRTLVSWASSYLPSTADALNTPCSLTLFSLLYKETHLIWAMKVRRTHTLPK